MRSKPILSFVSTRFLFPADSGGKIRTGQILRGLTGGSFHIRLLMPDSSSDTESYADEIASICDEWISWPVRRRSPILETLIKVAALFEKAPIPVAVDRDSRASRIIADEIEREPDVIVFDFPHSAILAPKTVSCPSVMFTHNIEAEIFRRHYRVAPTFAHRWLWRNQYRKMLDFERATLSAFDHTIAVSERDREFFHDQYGISECTAIPTGVDTEFFAYSPPADGRQVVFCGSMDWMANIDAVEYFHDRIWPKIVASRPDARMKVVGRTPPDGLVRRVRAQSPSWEFTGFVNDVREHVPGSAVFVIPLRVGGGTRIKAFEAMAMGCPVVSTSIGIEGLPVTDGVHFLRADDDQSFADRVLQLLDDSDRRHLIAESARRLVEDEFGFRKAAAVFEDACLRVRDQRAQ